MHGPARSRPHRIASAALSLLTLTPACNGTSTGQPAFEPSAQRAPEELVLERALDVEAEGDFEPSGLLVSGERLLTVSDKHDTALFELELTEGTARARPFLHFRAPEDVPLDLEGITRGPEGSYLVASETQHRLLQITPQGDAIWATPSLRAGGEPAGLFAKVNAGIEGVALLRDALVVAVEREPRGLLEIGIERGSPRPSVVAYRVTAPWPAPRGRPDDFSDLAVFEDTLFALDRNAHLVVRLERRHGHFEEASAWSYAQTENDARFAFLDRRFGLGEGLALDERHVYVVLDNNGQARRTHPQDHRPLLFVFRRPG